MCYPSSLMNNAIPANFPEIIKNVDLLPKEELLFGSESVVTDLKNKHGYMIV